MNGDELIYCGQRRFRFEREFHGSMFCDNQVSNVYALWLDHEEEDFILQEEEVSGVRWMDFADCVSAVRENRISSFTMEELELHRKMHCICIDSRGGRETAQYFQRRSSR